MLNKTETDLANLRAFLRAYVIAHYLQIDRIAVDDQIRV